MKRRDFIKCLAAFSLLPTFKEKVEVITLTNEETERIFFSMMCKQFADDLDHLYITGNYTVEGC